MGDAVPHASIGTRSLDVAGGSAEDELPDTSIAVDPAVWVNLNTDIAANGRYT